jgi:AraC-like DNA-binding protein
MIPYEKMTAKLVFLRNLTFILTFIVLCAGFFISFLMAINMYKPVRHILERLNYIPTRQLLKKKSANMYEDEFIEKRLDYLSSAAEISEPLIRNTFILNLLKNQHIENNLACFNNQVIASVFQEPYYLVCVFSIDEQIDEHNEQTEDEMQINQRNTLLKIAVGLQKIVAVTIDAVELSPTDIALILHLETGAFPGGLVPLIRETGEMVNKLGGFSVSASVGSIVNSIYAINDSFEEAEAGLKERFYMGEGIIVTNTADKGRREIAFSGAEELYKALLSGEAQNIKKSLDNFSHALEQTSYEYSRLSLNTTIIETLSLYMANKIAVDANSFYHLAGQLQKAQTLKKVSALLSGFFLDLAGEGNINSPADSSPLLIQDAVKMVSTHYSDPNFSINTAAVSFNITPAYFNRIFKKYHQISYSEFLNEYRIEKACELLKTSNKSVNAIASAVGINNTTYFYTLFKKIHNITPQQFRSNSRK